LNVIGSRRDSFGNGDPKASLNLRDVNIERVGNDGKPRSKRFKSEVKGALKLQNNVNGGSLRANLSKNIQAIIDSKSRAQKGEGEVKRIKIFEASFKDFKVIAIISLKEESLGRGNILRIFDVIQSNRKIAIKVLEISYNSDETGGNIAER